jgi:hypothetical protein
MIPCSIEVYAVICDICNTVIVEQPGCLLGTKDVVTSIECWRLYLRSSLTDKVLTIQDLANLLPGLVGQMACSDTPWALCENCTASLEQAGFSFRPATEELQPRGHELCRSTKLMEFEVLDDEGMALALKAANAAAS